MTARATSKGTANWSIFRLYGSAKAVTGMKLRFCKSLELVTNSKCASKRKYASVMAKSLKSLSAKTKRSNPSLREGGAYIRAPLSR